MMMLLAGAQVLGGAVGAAGAQNQAQGELHDLHVQRQQAAVAAGRESFDADRLARRRMAEARAQGASSGVNQGAAILSAAQQGAQTQRRVAEDLSVTQRTLRARGANVRSAARAGTFSSILGGLGGAAQSLAIGETMRR